MPVLLGVRPCAVLYTAPTLLSLPVACVPASDMALVGRRGYADTVLRGVPGRWYALGWRGYVGWVRLTVRPSWDGGQSP